MSLSFFRNPIRHLIVRFAAAALLFGFGTGAGPAYGAEGAEIAADLPASIGIADSSFIPSEYGEVIYQKDGANPRQIYIIGQSHRSGATGRNGDDTVQVQTEIYRIGEHLIREGDIELLLPEGFFQRRTDGALAPAHPARATTGLDSQTLSAMLSSEKRFVNADMLLNDSYNIRLAQVEDEELYQNVRRLLQQEVQEKNLTLLSRLDLAQEKRSAAMLQNIADVVEQAYREGAISTPRAIFTIGLAHVDEIIDFLKEGEIHLKREGDSGEDYQEELKLLQEGYGVTVIIPRTLAENEEALRLTRLNLE